MSRSFGGRGRGYLARLSAFAVLIPVGVAAFSTSGWAVDGGYGPGGTSSSGGGGTFGDVIVATTVGPDGGTVLGHFHGTRIDILIEPGELTTEEVVVVMSSTPDCKALAGRDTVIGLAVFLVNKKHEQEKFSGGAKAIISNAKINPRSVIFAVEHDGCTTLRGLDLDYGQVTVPLQLSSAFAISSPFQISGDSSYDGQGRCNGNGDGGCGPQMTGLSGMSFLHEWMHW